MTGSEWMLFEGTCSSPFFFAGTAALLFIGRKQRKLYWLMVVSIPA
jgi:hypothetical protein